MPRLHNKQPPATSLFKLLFVIFAVILVILPFATTFNELLTRMIEHTSLYRLLQVFIVPYMSSILYQLLAVLPGLQVKAIPTGVVINGTDVLVGWNCLGWQSFLLFFLSLLVGLRGKFTAMSLCLALAFGVAGTFLVNIFRMVFTAALAGWYPPLFVLLFHNYFASFLTILWLFFFWWFVYQFVLEERQKT